LITFKDQIDEDIKEIREEYIYLDSKLKDEAYAFNFWVLHKLYSIDEQIASNWILEDSDRGIDCYFFNEDQKELYLIQNKYYNEKTALEYSSVVDQFLSRSLEHLHQGVYKRSKELQEIFSKYKNDEEFKIFLHFYVTNDLHNKYEYHKTKLEQYKYSSISCIVIVEFFCLDDIKEKYYKNRIKLKQNFETELYTLDKQTRVNIQPERINDKIIRSQFMPVRIILFTNC